MSVGATGIERIAEAFESARASGRRAAFMPYLMAGYPDAETAAAVARVYVDGGADLIELGIPFSDPLADGPVIHAAAVDALAGGATVASSLELARAIAAEVPVIVMCYANLVLARGLERFADVLVETGAAGLIVPDLPLEEAPATLAACDERGLALVPLVAPTTPTGRLAEIGSHARGFLYTVSVTGTTGERSANGNDLADVLARARAATDVPVAVGFGISTPAQALAAAEAGADGVIVGSRLVRAAAAGDRSQPTEIAAEVGALVSDFSAALRDRVLG